MCKKIKREDNVGRHLFIALKINTFLCKVLKKSMKCSETMVMIPHKITPGVDRELHNFVTLFRRKRTLFQENVCI